jgi:hypothetical protein
MQQRRLDQGGDDEHVHGRVAREPRVANIFRDAHAPVNFHGASVAPFHLREKLWRWLLLKQNAAHASSAQVDCERQADRAGADDKDLRIQSNIPQRLRIENAIILSIGAEAAHA